ncbi:MAG: redoxin domain-containing protein [Candidatus Portnoybacteria bacterium]|nr:redoxin domain-containing protein [Candidatus Portnoybacteria bacterium]
MSKSNFYLIPLAILIAAVMVAVGIFYKEKKQQTEVSLLRQGQIGELVAPTVGFSAPFFNLKNINGTDVSLNELRGRNVLLVFAASNCDFCQQELSDLEKFVDAHRGLIAVFAIYNRESLSVLRDYGKENNINFSILIDRDGSVFQNYKVSGTPAHFLVDKSGIISAVWPGAAPLSALEGLAATLDK